MGNRDKLEENIKKYHERFDDGKIPVYDNVVVIGETLVSLDNDDRDGIAIVLHDGNTLEGVFHLTLDAAIKLCGSLLTLLEDTEDESN